MKLLILLSGGLDSAVVLASCKEQGHECSAIGFDYGQLHAIELERAADIALHYFVPYKTIQLPPMPLVNDVVFAGRNLVLVAHGIAHAQAEGIDAVAVGCNASDWLRFPDCRPPFWAAVETAASFYDVAVLAPLLHHSKLSVVAQARRLGVPVELTWSCYSPQDGKPCGKCLACETRKGALECQPCL